MNLFFPITKVDAAQRLVFGVATAEVVDKANEICDYASTKPLFEKWSGEISKASGGKSLGNVRSMHTKIAAGKVEQMVFNDEAKQVEIAVKVVDDAEWNKVEEGVYTGFSQGGKYIKRWQDAADPAGVTRYTAEPTEVSLVDNPCLSVSHFTMVKADGSEEQVAFKAVEGNAAAEDAKAESASKSILEKSEAAAREPAQIWDCGNPAHKHGLKKDAVTCIGQQDAFGKATCAAQAATDAIAALGAALNPPAEKAAGDVAREEPVAGKSAAADAPVAGNSDATAEAVAGNSETVAGKSAGNSQAVAGKSAASAAAPAETGDTRPASATEAAAAATGAEKADKAAGDAETAKPGDAAAKADGADLKKSLYAVRELASILTDLRFVTSDAQWEAEYEGDDSPIPAKLREAVANLGQILVEMTQEEVAELVAALPKPAEAVVVLEAAAPAEMTKDAGAAADDLEKLTAERDALLVKFDDIAKAIAPLTETVTALQKSNAEQAARLKKLEDQPEVPKFQRVRTVEKGADTGTEIVASGDPAADARREFEKTLAGLPPAQRAAELMKAALSNPVFVADAHNR